MIDRRVLARAHCACVRARAYTQVYSRNETKLDYLCTLALNKRKGADATDYHEHSRRLSVRPLLPIIAVQVERSSPFALLYGFPKHHEHPSGAAVASRADVGSLQRAACNARPVGLPTRTQRGVCTAGGVGADDTAVGTR